MELLADSNSSVSLYPNRTCPPFLPNTHGASDCLSPFARLNMVIVFSVFTFLAILANIALIAYIVVNRLYRNFVSSHFIAHLSLTNTIASIYLVPVFIYNLHQGGDGEHLFASVPGLCRIHAFLTCAIWSVICYMTTCVAGVHLLTFARIHYDQLFGLPPTVICLLSWVIGAALGLPCLTNSDIAFYDPLYHHCIWGYTINGYKFLAYIVLLGVLLPLLMTLYSYVRVLGIFYHSPIVFQALGLYKSRFLVYALLLLSFCQLPFYASRFFNHLHPLLHPLLMFGAYAMCILHAPLFAASLFLMKEEDMALTARAHRTTYTQPGLLPPQEL